MTLTRQPIHLVCYPLMSLSLSLFLSLSLYLSIYLSIYLSCREDWGWYSGGWGHDGTVASRPFFIALAGHVHYVICFFNKPRSNHPPPPAHTRKKNPAARLLVGNRLPPPPPPPNHGFTTTNNTSTYLTP